MFNSVDNIISKHNKALGVFSKAKEKLAKVLDDANDKSEKNEKAIFELNTENAQLHEVCSLASSQIGEIDKILGAK